MLLLLVGSLKLGFIFGNFSRSQMAETGDAYILVFLCHNTHKQTSRGEGGEWEEGARGKGGDKVLHHEREKGETKFFSARSEIFFPLFRTEDREMNVCGPMCGSASTLRRPENWSPNVLNVFHKY